MWLFFVLSWLVVGRGHTASSSLGVFDWGFVHDLDGSLGDFERFNLFFSFLVETSERNLDLKGACETSIDRLRRRLARMRASHTEEIKKFINGFIHLSGLQILIRMLNWTGAYGQLLLHWREDTMDMHLWSHNETTCTPKS